MKYCAIEVSTNVFTGIQIFVTIGVSNTGVLSLISNTLICIISGSESNWGDPWSIPLTVILNVEIISLSSSLASFNYPVSKSIRKSAEPDIFSNLHDTVGKNNNKLICTSALRLIGRFTTCLAQTTTALRLLFASTRHFVSRQCEKIGFFQILYHHDDVIIR